MDPGLRRLGRAFKGLFQEQRDILGGGIALFAVLSFFPAVGAIVTIYNLAADPSDIAHQLQGMRRILPNELVSLVSSQLEMAANQSTGRLSVTLVVTILLAIWSLRAALDGTIAVVSRIFDRDQCRTWVQRQGLSLAMSAIALFASVFVVAVVVGLPAIAALVGLEDTTRELIEWIRWPAIVALAVMGLATIYRVAPCSVRLGLRDVWPGALVGALLWLIVSYVVSVSVEKLGATSSVPGVVGTIFVVLLWFYASSLTVLVGALYNADEADKTAAYSRRG